ncbi:MAG: FtsX-like permease family protein [Clostridiales bacterium]
MKNKSSVIVLRFVDTDKFPLYPNKKKKVNYKKNLQEGNAIILSSNVALRISAKKGDKVNVFNKLTGNNESYKVSEIVEPDGETGQDMNIFGYAILNIKNTSKFTSINNASNKLYVRVNDKSKINDLNKELKKNFAHGEVKTTNDVFESAKKQIESTKNALAIIGILTFIIAGIGIANTMLLSVLKRQRELSVLKVFGMKNRQLTFFMGLEAIIMSLLSSIIGIPLGITFSSIINYIIYENWIDYSIIPYMVMPIIYIIVVSILVSIVFTFIPVTICNKISAISVLREQYIKVGEKLGLVEPILLITFIVGITFSLFLKSFSGILYSFLLLICGAFLYVFLTIILKGVSKLPTMSNKSLIFAFRNLGRQNKRISMVLVTLIIGIVSIGITINISNSILPALKEIIEKQFGYNVLISTSLKNVNNVEEVLKKEKNVNSYTQSLRTETFFKTINGRNKESVFQKQLTNPLYKDKLKNLLIEGLKFDKQTIYNKIKKGRDLNSTDKEKNSAVIGTELADSMNIKVDDEIGLLINGKNVIFKVIGIKDKTLINTSQISTSFYMLSENTNWNSVIYYINVNNKNLKTIVKTFNQNLDGVFVLDINDLLPSLNKTISNQIMIFTFIAIFCIIASIFLMSNMTLMTFLDRMKEFILIKIMGAQNNSIRYIIILESLIVGLIGGIISTVFIEILTSIFFSLILKMKYVTKYSTVAEMIALSIVIVCISALFVIPQIKVKQLNLLLRSE